MPESAGYEAVAQEFMTRRDPAIGVSIVERWARQLPPGGAVLDLGCGHGVPISETLISAGCDVHGVDASPTLVAAFRERFPAARVACERIETSDYFGRAFHGVVAWGVVFLLPPDAQLALVQRIAGILEPGGSFLFTAPEEDCTWVDVLTGHTAVSLGGDAYRASLRAAGCEAIREHRDEGENHYFEARKT